MKFFMNSKRKISSSLIAGLLVCSFVFAPISSSLQVREAHAGSASAGFQALQLAKEALSAVYDGITSAAISSIATKEYVLDGIAWALINLVLQEMIRSTTQWVNSGFNGSPAFVTDLEGFLTDIADRVAGEFIWGSDLQALCSPFKLDIQIALDIQYQKTRSGSNFSSECRLSDVVTNMENFIGGDFLEGGWDGWYSLTLTPQNNPYGALLEAQSELSATLSNSRAQETKLLEFGRGFLSFKNAEGVIVTPGVVIEDQLNKTLGIPQGRLTVADELNELLGALFTQLTSSVLSGAGGLLGLTNSNYGGGGNYFGGLAAEVPTLGFVETSNTALSEALAIEQRNLSLQQTIVGLITGASTYKNRVYGNNQQCGTGALSAALNNQLTAARTSITNTNVNIGRINAFIADYQTLRSTSATNAAKQAIVAKYGATSIPAAETLLMQQFSTYQSNGSLNTNVGNVTTELETVPAVQATVTAFTASIDVACRQNGIGGIGGILGF